jgi:16S rRNA (guanine1207-N2)-methyltransferase
VSRLPARGQALLIGRDTGAVRKALRKADFTVARWERFCSGSRVGSAWPKGTAAFAIVNLAAGLEWLEMDLLAAAASVPTGAPVYCYGHRDDRSMLTRCRTQLPAKFFTFGRQTEVTASTFWACLIRNDVSVGSFGTASGWKSKDTLELGGHSVPWTTWPGLFAGGGMDVMTAFLLQNLPVIADRARVLDFCAGSGTIAKSILLTAPTASVTLLDADALAVRAAKRNVADATTILSDGWEHLPKKARFDLIVSNPPVHRGRCQDFSVLEDLVTGALAHLRPNGQLIFVTQSYVPTALVGTVGAASSLKLVAYDGRFTVWRLGGGETVPQLSDRKRKRGAAASTKSHRKEKRKKRESNP